MRFDPVFTGSSPELDCPPFPVSVPGNIQADFIKAHPEFIRDINFVSSPDEYISQTTGIQSERIGSSSSVGKSYDLQGRRFLPSRHGIAVSKGQKVLK